MEILVSFVVVLCFLTELAAFFHGRTGAMVHRAIQPARRKWLQQPSIARIHKPSTAFRHKRNHESSSQRMLLNPLDSVKHVVSVFGTFAKQLVEDNGRSTTPSLAADPECIINDQCDEEALYKSGGSVTGEKCDTGTFSMANAEEYVYPDGGKYVGQMAAGKHHGQGIFTDKKSRVLQGEWKEGKIHNGNGSLFFPTTKDIHIGTWVDGKREGNGSFVSPDGYKYVGEFSQDLRHGQGTMTYADGTEYEGEWARGKRHGQGKETDKEGRVLQGEWKEGKIHNGSGVVRFIVNGMIISGTWVNGKREGNGSTVSPDGFTYRGEFRQSLRHGQGTMTYPDGTVYEGEWARDKMHGYGTQTDKEGRVLQGEWREGKIHNGSGVVRFIDNGHILSGTWVNGMMEGNGSVVTERHTYVGDFSQGKYQGRGKLVYPSGTVHIGEFARGKPHGQGTQTDKHKRVVQGEWKESKIHNGSGVMHFIDNGHILSGTWVNGMMEGNGSVVTQNHTYVGEFVQGKYQGRGKLVYPSGTVHIGEFARGKPHGQGTQTDKEGRVLQGEWKEGRTHNCKGTLLFLNSKDVVTGTWVNGMMEGNGSVVSHGHLYVGEFSQGNYHGRGKLVFPDGTVHIGEFAGDKPHGQGTRTDKEGHVLQGEWIEGKIHNGAGVMRFGNEMIKTGTWVMGKMEGHGSDVSSTGRAYVGEYRQGQKHGQGTMTYPDGTVYEGEWARDKPNGHGKQTKASGKVWIGEWKDGKKVF